MANAPTMISEHGRPLPLLGAARPDDRWRVFDVRRPVPRLVGAVLAASLLAHAAVLVVALLWSRRVSPAPEPIPVELVAEPAPQPPSAKPSPPAPPPTPPQPSAAEQQRAALERELAALKAQQKALEETRTEKAAEADKADAAQTAEAQARRGLLDSIQGLALPSDAANGDILVGYKTLVFSQLAKAKQGFPPGTVSGVAGIVFAVTDEGVLRDLRVAVSSGVKSLDEEAEAIVRRASPFPRPPEGAQRVFSVNVSFAVPTR